VVWYLKQLVTVRAARYTIGTSSGQPYDPSNFLHRSRQDLKYEGLEYVHFYSIVLKLRSTLVEKRALVCSLYGRKRLDIYYSYVSGGNRRHTNFACRMPRLRWIGLLKWHTVGNGQISPELWASIGSTSTQVMMSRLLIGFVTRQVICSHTLLLLLMGTSGNLMPNIEETCAIEADLKDLVSSLTIKNGPTGNIYWELEFSVLISFKGTKMQARLRWKNEVSKIILSLKGWKICWLMDGLKKGQQQEGPTCILPGVAY
jgi:hypothetical protein